MKAKPFVLFFISIIGGGFLLFTLLCWLSLSPSSVQAASPSSLNMLPANHEIPQITATLPLTVYLPLTLKNTITVPSLIAPQNGAVLDTLIPLIQWDMGSQPSNASACLAFSTTPNPTNCNASGFGSSGQKEVVVWYNLQPSTVYYWRAAVIFDSNYSNKFWSEQRTFTTGPAGGTILPAPALLSPANNSTVSPSNLTLQWTALQGAIEYAITIHDIDLDDWYGFDSSTSQLILTSWLDPTTHYEWFVEARNNYAWGTSSETWKFTTTAGGAPSETPETSFNFERINPDGTRLKVIR